MVSPVASSERQGGLYGIRIKWVFRYPRQFLVLVFLRDLRDFALPDSHIRENPDGTHLSAAER